MDKQEYLNKIAEKLSIDVKEVESEFKEFYANEGIIHKDLSEEQQEQRALQRLALSYKKQMRSPAVGFEGIIIGMSDCVDTTLRQKREAKEIFEMDPETAVTSGVTDNEGNALDQRKEWGEGRSNPQYGKPLPDHNYLKNIWGIAKRTKNGSEAKFFSMVLSGQKAQDETIPLFKPVKFMAIDKGERLNASTFTEFNIAELVLPNYRGLIEQYAGTQKMSELEAYHNINKEDRNRLCIVEGDVSSLNLEPTAFGSRIMSIEDAEASLEDLDAKGVTCWLPERINIDFAEGSKVLVVGRTAQGKKRDEQGQPTDEPGDVTLNVYGIYALPEFKISLPEEIQPITEENLDIK